MGRTTHGLHSVVSSCFHVLFYVILRENQIALDSTTFSFATNRGNPFDCSIFVLVYLGIVIFLE